MHFDLNRRAKHTGEEQYTIEYLMKDQGNVYDVQADGAKYTIRPSLLLLAWHRPLGGAWRRDQYASKIFGDLVLRSGAIGNRQSYKSVYTSFYQVGMAKAEPRLSAYALSLPHLADLIKDIEAHLPE